MTELTSQLKEASYSLDIPVRLIYPLQVTRRYACTRQLTLSHSILQLVNRSLFQDYAIAVWHWKKIFDLG